MTEVAEKVQVGGGLKTGRYGVLNADGYKCDLLMPDCVLKSDFEVYHYDNDMVGFHVGWPSVNKRDRYLLSFPNGNDNVLFSVLQRIVTSFEDSPAKFYEYVSARYTVFHGNRFGFGFKDDSGWHVTYELLNQAGVTLNRGEVTYGHDFTGFEALDVAYRSAAANQYPASVRFIPAESSDGDPK